MAVGGDGTIHEVMNGIVKNKNITLGFMPGGQEMIFPGDFIYPQIQKKR